MEEKAKKSLSLSLPPEDCTRHSEPLNHKFVIIKIIIIFDIMILTLLSLSLSL